eukprot:COSAG02_NODE_19_length_53976_cov_37.338512_23_plen_294_part_00
MTRKSESRPSAGMSIITSFSSEFDPSVRVARARARRAVRPSRSRSLLDAACMRLTAPSPTALLLVLAILSAAPHTAVTLARRLHSLSLDGVGWTLTLDAADPATRRIKAAGNKTTGPIVVPGAWEAQGFGEETPTMNNQYIGVGTYSRNISLPPSFVSPPPGTSVWLVVERIQRAATVTVGGAVIGQHTGYLSPFEGDVTTHIASGNLALQIEVNATRHQDFDGLQGEEDLETDNTGLGGWGGATERSQPSQPYSYPCSNTSDQTHLRLFRAGRARAIGAPRCWVDCQPARAA